MRNSASWPRPGLGGSSPALETLARGDARKAELVKLRYFAGLHFAGVAAALIIAAPSATQWWAYARAWLTVDPGTTDP